MRTVLLITCLFVTQVLWSQNKQTHQLKSIFQNAKKEFQSYRGKVVQVFAGDTTFMSTLVLDGAERAVVHNTVSHKGGVGLYIPARYIATLRKEIKPGQAEKIVREWKDVVAKQLGKECVTTSVSLNSPSGLYKQGFNLKNGVVSVLILSVGKEDSFDVNLSIQQDASGNGK